MHKKKEAVRKCISKRILLFTLTLALVLSAFFYMEILSLFDGCELLWRDKSSDRVYVAYYNALHKKDPFDSVKRQSTSRLHSLDVPTGLKIPPKQLPAICNLYLGASGEKASIKAIYRKENLYYVCLDDECCSYEAVYGGGIAVDGNTGMVLDKSDGTWKEVGYTFFCFEEIKKRIPIGSNLRDVTDTLGCTSVILNMKNHRISGKEVYGMLYFSSSDGKICIWMDKEQNEVLEMGVLYRL